MAKNNYLGNGTTIGKFLLVMIAGRALAMAAAYGINLPISDVELAGYLGLLLGFIYSILDSYFKNNINWTHIKEIISFMDKPIEEEDEDVEVEDEMENDIDPTTETEKIELEDEDVVGEEDEC